MTEIDRFKALFNTENERLAAQWLMYQLLKEASLTPDRSISIEKLKEILYEIKNEKNTGQFYNESRPGVRKMRKDTCGFFRNIRSTILRLCKKLYKRTSGM